MNFTSFSGLNLCTASMKMIMISWYTSLKDSFATLFDLINLFSRGVYWVMRASIASLSPCWASCIKSFSDICVLIIPENVVYCKLIHERNF